MQELFPLTTKCREFIQLEVCGERIGTELEEMREGREGGESKDQEGDTER